MYKLNLFTRKALIILAAILSAMLDTIVVWTGVVLAGALVSVVAPVVLMFATAGLAKIKLKMVR